MKKRLIVFLVVNCSVYLFISFIKWDIQWFLEMPRLRTCDRFGVLCVFSILNFASQLIATISTPNSQD